MPWLGFGHWWGGDWGALTMKAQDPQLRSLPQGGSVMPFLPQHTVPRDLGHLEDPGWLP